MKPIATCLFLLVSIAATAQEFSGFRHSNYSGVNGVFFNPASISGNRYKWDVNILSIGSSVGNNKASFRFDDLGTLSGEDFEEKLLQDTEGPSSGLANLEVHGPSAMFSIKKSSFAITTRLRTLANLTDIDGKLINKISSDFETDPDLPYTIASNNNMRISANGWAEIGVSYARELFQQGRHSLKAGASLKYLHGAANTFLNVNRFQGTIQEDAGNSDAYLSNSSGRLGMGFAGISFADFELNDLLENNGSGFGADLGFVYELAKEDVGYHFRAGISLLDIGSLKYTLDPRRSGSYEINVSGAERFYLSELDGLDIDDYRPFFDSRPEFFTPLPGNSDNSYTVALPTRLLIDLDYSINAKFYLNLGAQVPLSKTSDKPFNSQYYNAVSLTPRFETRRFGMALPLSYNELTHFNAGLSLHLGPVFLGSGSAITSLVGDSKQVDFFLGFRFGRLR